jgi:hypothetical protein
MCESRRATVSESRTELYNCEVECNLFSSLGQGDERQKPRGRPWKDVTDLPLINRHLLEA